MKLNPLHNELLVKIKKLSQTYVSHNRKKGFISKIRVEKLIDMKYTNSNEQMV